MERKSSLYDQPSSYFIEINLLGDIIIKDTPSLLYFQDPTKFKLSSK